MAKMAFDYGKANQKWFDKLPTELICEISKHLYKLHDLNSLVRCCKRLATCLTPRLYNKHFSPVENSDCYRYTINQALWSYEDTVQRLHEPAEYWGSEYVLSYFAKIPLEWITRVQSIDSALYMPSLGENLLEIVARAGNCHLLKLFLDRGIDIDTRCQCGNTLLHVASGAALPGTVQLLLDSGGDITARNNGGLTALCLAISEDYFDVALLLLDADVDGATVNIAHSPDGGMTPLVYAIRGYQCSALVERLLEKGADMFASSGGYPVFDPIDAFIAYWDFSPLDTAIFHRKDEVAFLLVDRMVAMPKELSELGPTWGNGMPLFIAIRAGFSSMVRRLVTEGIDLTNAMDVVIREGGIETFNILNESKTELWPRTIITDTFQWVCEQNNLMGLEMILCLLENGKLLAEMSELDKQFSLGRTIYNPFIKSQAPEMVSLLLTKGASADTMLYNALNDSESGETALQVSIRSLAGKEERSLFEAIKLLINASKDINLMNSHGENYLHQVAMMSKYHVPQAAEEIAIMECLLFRGIDINSRDSNRNTTLHIVASRGHACREEVLAYLLSKGAYSNLENSRKETPLSLIFLNGGSLLSALLLIQAGADLSGDFLSKPVLFHHAAETQRYDFAELLYEAGFEKHENCPVCLRAIEEVTRKRVSTVETSTSKSSGSTDNEAALMETAHGHNPWEYSTFQQLRGSFSNWYLNP